ncbi:MAG: hypothetical protein ABSF26_26080 [Thermoguttaceae bacterium]|jgi:hypothetical protein
MRIMRQYNGRRSWVVAEEVFVWEAGGLVGGQFYGAFSLTDEPLTMLGWETVREDAKTKLFPTVGEAVNAAIKAAEARIDGKTGEMV